MGDADLAGERVSYGGTPLRRGDLLAHPMEQFHRWFVEVREAGIAEPNAMVLATADARGLPRARTVLLKGYDTSGVRFFTSHRSRKGRELAANPHGSVVFPWHPARRQVIISGEVMPLPDAENDAYFAQRPRGSQLGAWASGSQSEPVASHEELTHRFAEYARRWPEGEEVPRPDFWGGYRLRPVEVEFWQGQADRMHDRFRYTRQPPRDGAEVWWIERLAP